MTPLFAASEVFAEKTYEFGGLKCDGALQERAAHFVDIIELLRVGDQNVACDESGDRSDGHCKRVVNAVFPRLLVAMVTATVLLVANGRL